MSSTSYPNPCPRCGAKPFQPCVALTNGKRTDTHAIRLHLSHQVPRCRTCHHERVDGPRCDYCGTVAGSGGQ